MIYKIIADISCNETDKVFDYYGNDGIEIGMRVLVPFGPRLVEGYVVGVSENTLCDIEKLKSIHAVLDDYPVIIPEMFYLCSLMQKQFHLRIVDCIRLFIPGGMRKNKIKKRFEKYLEIYANDNSFRNNIKSGAKKQLALFDKLIECNQIKYNAAIKEYGNSAVKSLIQKDIVKIIEYENKRTPYASTQTESNKHILNSDQERCVNAVLNSENDIFLLHGVTGSGKTEVYMTIIENCLNENKTAIMLVPEISLTPNMMLLFRSRFGENVALLHSGLSLGERYDEWCRLREGSAKIAIGARSAIFAPISNIGIIIIDEEHDSSYQSDNNPRYNTIKIAELRCKYNNCSLLLGSATPSLESYYKALHGEYKLLKMPERINQKPLPNVKLIDMTRERLSGNKSFMSQALIESLRKAIKEGNQAILFLNRRGYSSYVLCTKCGYVAKCSDCDVSLYYHRDENILKCHYCGKKFKMFDLCPNCKSEYLRQGKIGTEQVVDYLKRIFPDIGILRMDMDTTQNKEAHLNILKDFGNRKAQILVGTQMVTKGHDFPYVTLVGILEGDQSLYMANYRSAERTFQLITQVAGRCGRKDLSGEVILQTFTPNHYALQYAAKQDYLGFYNHEICIREATKFPPFSKIIKILYSSEDSEKAIKCINDHYKNLIELQNKYENDFIFMQKMRAPIKKIEKKFRFQIIIRLEIENSDLITDEIFKICDLHNKNVNVFIDINPQNMN